MHLKQRLILQVPSSLQCQQALDLHQRCKPDLILLDMQMPKLDVWQVLNQIRARSETTVIMLTEFKLLTCLMRAPHKVFSREELLVNCLPEGDTQERTVDSHVSKLRKKLEALQSQGVPLSVWGVGYRFGGEL
jgi:DNA-binding response OmpR family regulator